jgi:TetR/AcrR family transcriptional regulator, transcriptional repressor of bet genes
VAHEAMSTDSHAERLESLITSSRDGSKLQRGESEGTVSARGTRSESRSDDLIEAAVWMVAAHGVTGATIERIADAAHVSRGLPRHYFKTKDQLLTAAYGRLAIEFLATLRQGAGQGGVEPLASLNGALTAVFNPPHFNVDRLRAWFGFWHASPRNRSFNEVDRWVSEAQRTFLEDLLARAAEERRLDIDVEAVARGLLLLMDGAFVALASTSDTLTASMAERLCRDYARRALGLESV